MAAVIEYHASFASTVRRCPEEIREQLLEVFERLQQAHPALPASGDEAVALPPLQLVVWRRRLAGTAWWLHYTVTVRGVMVRSIIRVE